MSRLFILGGLLGLVATLLPFVGRAQSTPSPEAVVVTEVMYAPSPSSNEFVELYNRSDAPVNLGTIEYADAGRSFAPVAPTDTLLSPGEHVVLVRDTAAFEAAFPSVDYLAPPDWDALNNGGDLILLRTAGGTVLDSLPYDPSWGGADGRSLERIDPAAPSTAESNFASSTAAAGATPDRRNSIHAPDETPPTPVFAEQIDDTVVRVTFSEPVRPSSVTPSAFTLESTTVVGASLSSDTAAVLSLEAAPTGTTLRARGLEDRVGNVLDASSQVLAHRPEETDVTVNEILFDPRADDYDDRPNQVEYVELLNRTSTPLTLTGLVLTDRPDERGVADTIRAGRRVALPAEGYGVVAAAPNGVLDPLRTQLAHAFPDAPLAADSVAFLPVDAGRLGLDNDGALVRLHRADGTPIGEVSYVPDWHAEGLEETKGTALERISPTGRANAADNWTSSPAPAGGTPGTANAVSLSPSAPPPEATLEVSPSPFSIERDGAARIQYALDDVPNLVRARVFDARGRKVRTLEDARLTGRSGELVWNGRDDAGNRVRVGLYVVLFEAVRADDGTVTARKAPVVVARPLH